MARVEVIDGVNPDRIRWCCDELDISVDDLADATDISAKTLSRVMAGVGGLTFNQLRKIGEFFNRGVLFFLQSGTVQPSKANTPEFRTLANQKPEITREVRALIRRAEYQRETLLSLLEDLGEQPERFDPPQLQAADAKAAAAVARKWLALDGQCSFREYRRAVEDRGVLVILTSGYRGAWHVPQESRVSGFSLHYAVYPLILVRKSTAEARQTFTLMHELGHLLLHRGSFIDDFEELSSEKGKERTANAFAGNLLVPDEFLQQIPSKTRPDDVAEFDAWLGAYRTRWGVSGEVILRRLSDIGRLPNHAYNAYRAWSEQQPRPVRSGGGARWRYREPIHLFGEQYVRTVLDALSARAITLRKASSHLDNIKVEDMHKLREHVHASV